MSEKTATEIMIEQNEAMLAARRAAIVENELICEKLLGWSKVDGVINQAGKKNISCFDWLDHEFNERCTPTFSDWTSAGLIIDAMKSLGYDNAEFGLDGSDEKSQWYFEFWKDNWDRSSGYGSTIPLAIRAAALMFLKKDLTPRK